MRGWSRNGRRAPPERSAYYPFLRPWRHGLGVKHRSLEWLAVVHVNGTKRMVQQIDGTEQSRQVGGFGARIPHGPGYIPVSAAGSWCHPTGKDVNIYDVSGLHKTPPCPAGKPTQWFWSDWFFVGTPGALAPLGSMTDSGLLVYDQDMRCWGLCQEEQTVLHLERAGVQLKRLELPLRKAQLAAIPCDSAPLLNLTELWEQHSISSWYAPCPVPSTHSSTRCRRPSDSDSDADRSEGGKM